jgi:hypothetical protein
VLVVAGDVYYDERPAGIEVVSLVDRFGEEPARDDVLACVESVVRERLTRARATRR